MNFSNIPEITQTPKLQIAPLIDIIFLLLIFFMSASIFYQLESEMNVTVPTASQATEMRRTPGEIIINVLKDGRVVVNQRELSEKELTGMLSRISSMYKGQPVIIRADKKTHHEDVIKVLDVCAKTDIWNVSFATLKEKEK